MDRARVLGAVGAACLFVVVVAAGAFAIVSLTPRAKPVTVVKDALLMESAPSRPRDPTFPDRGATLTEPEPAAPPAESRVASLPATPDADVRASPDKPAASAPSGEAAMPVPRKPSRVPVAAPPPSAHLPDAVAPPVRIPAPPPERRIEGVMAASDIRRLRSSLRLTREQLPFWPPVEQALLEIGAQQAALARAGQDPKSAFGFSAAIHIFSVARPLLDVLREDQKAQIRERARTMGFGAIASSI